MSQSLSSKIVKPLLFCNPSVFAKNKRLWQLKCSIGVNYGPLQKYKIIISNYAGLPKKYGPHVVLGVSNSFRFALALNYTLYIRYNCVNVFLYGQLLTSSSTLHHTTQCKANLTLTCRLKLTLFEWGLVSVEVEADVNSLLLNGTNV